MTNCSPWLNLGLTNCCVDHCCRQQAASGLARMCPGCPISSRPASTYIPSIPLDYSVYLITPKALLNCLLLYQGKSSQEEMVSLQNPGEGFFGLQIFFCNDTINDFFQQDNYRQYQKIVSVPLVMASVSG